MSVATVEVEIGEGLRAKLNAIAARFGGDAASIPLMAAAQVVVSAASANAPVLTGTLRRSIRAEVVGRDVLVGTELPYARRIEYGFNGADSRGRVYHQAARPYLRKAMDERKAEVADAIRRASADILKAI